MHVRLRVAPSLVMGAAAWLIAGPALAHEFWLAPSSYRGMRGDTIAIRAFVGTGLRGEQRPFASRRLVRLELHQRSQRALVPPIFDGEVDVVSFVLADQGGALVTYQSNHASIELPAAAFDDYLRTEGLDGPLAERARRGAGAGPGRERYARYAKLLVSGRDPRRVTKPVGLPLEIVPLDDPARAREARVRVIHRGKPLAGALVRAWKQSLARGAFPTDAATRDSVPPCFEARSDAQGTAVVRLEGDGEWLINAVHMIPSPPGSGADWESLWASLTFARTSSSVPPARP